MEETNLCFIGAGFHASTNIYPSAVEAGINIKAVATRNLEHSKKALLRFGCAGNAYENYMDMLKHENCQGVVVVAQPKDQFSIALECIKMGKNVFVDKPLGWNEDEARIIYNAAKQHNVFVMVGFMKRFAPCYKKIKEIIISKELGEPRSFMVNFAVDSTPFCNTEEDFIKLASIHIIDLLRFLFGEVSLVGGFSNSINGNVSQCFSLKFESGVVGSVYFSGMTAWSRESENITVTFDDGFAQVEEINKVIIHKSKKSKEISFASHTEEDRVFTPSATPMSGAYRDLYLRGFVGEMKHFAYCIQNGQEPLSNSESNISTMILCDKILESVI
ncbi:MAG: oxidoreductase family [Clostridiaceae bacterium]|nr:oxidoreductase family [Clostridiaceae bacterium]